MALTFKYGVDSELEFEIPPEVLVAHCGVQQSAAVADLAQATCAALHAPLDYPPLRQIVVRGDQVVLALAEGVPQADLVVKAVVEGLSEADIPAGDITLLCTAREAPAPHSDPLGQLPPSLRHDLRIVVHDPLDRHHLSYLAASGEAKPIYVNRALSDADLVIPIGCLRLDETLGYFGIHEGVFPLFSDAKNQERYRSSRIGELPVQANRFRHEVEEVSWLLGIQFLVQVVPGGGNSVLAVLAGHAHEVDHQRRQLCAQAWACSIPRRAELVIAAVDGPPGQQTWLNVARALASASRVVEDGGAIVLCTDLDEEFGPGLRRLMSGDNVALALHEIAKYHPIDSFACVQLAQARERGPLYLLSRLKPALIEELGVAPVTNAEQVARLVAQHDSCILLAHAQYTIATPQGELATVHKNPFSSESR